MTTPHTAICALCWSTFQAHTSYGLCPDCWSRDRLREFDRLESAKVKAERHNLPITLTLREWLATTSDFEGKCAYCQEIPYSFLEMVNPDAGLTWDNVVPVCRACSIHKACSFETAQNRVQAYLRRPIVDSLFAECSSEEVTT